MTDKLSKAEQIIERFGGIRPMAKAMGIAVTTVQGWKKRQSIPLARKEDVLTAAAAHHIDLSDILAPQAAAPAPASPQAEKFEDNVKDAAAQETPEVTARHEKAVADAAVTAQQDEERAALHEAAAPRRTPTSAELLREINEAQNKAMTNSLWASAALVVGVCVLLGVLLWPSKKQLDEQEEKLSALAGQVEAVREKQSVFKKLVPEEMQSKMEDLKKQAETIQTTVNDLSEKTERIVAVAQDLTGPDGGTLSMRLTHLEGQMEALGAPDDLSVLVQKLQDLSRSVEGQSQLSASFAELQDTVLNMQGRVDSLDVALAEKTQEEDSALGETLEGVSGTDLKAAALLIGFSQLRTSLHRDNQPFEDDLAVLEKLVGGDNEELNAAIEKLAPKAAEGVLTTDGLSSEFKGLAGDIVFSSLKGEEVSMKEKATARLHDVLQVEKDGEALTGTDTQVTVEQAQALLDEGDVQGAVALLQTLDGAAAETAQPFIDEAQMTLAAQQLQSVLGEEIMKRLPTGSAVGSSVIPALGNGVPYLPDLSSMGDVVEDVVDHTPLSKPLVTDSTGEFSIMKTAPYTP